MIKAAKESEIKRVSGAIQKFIVTKINTVIEESDSELLNFLKDQDLHNLTVSPVQIGGRATSSSTLGQRCDSDSEMKNDSPIVSFIENC